MTHSTKSDKRNDRRKYPYIKVPNDAYMVLLQRARQWASERKILARTEAQLLTFYICDIAKDGE